jgi:TetR/AcrR family transcriptional regulator, transcriptional repressor for nem operon
VARDGVAATSLDDIRAATGTSKSQLYHYFAGKADLVRAVVRHQGDAVVAAQHLHDEPPDSEAGLQRWRYRVVAAQRARGFPAGCPLGSLAAELLGAPSTDGATRAELDAAFRRWRELLATGLCSGVDAGWLPVGLDPEAGAEWLVAAVQGGSVLAALADAPAPLQAALDRAIAQLLAS